MIICMMQMSSKTLQQYYLTQKLILYMVMLLSQVMDRGMMAR